ncbi:hypothetical protein BZA70DRAFT_273067 [Myxozyma melibiosi]|uniref:FAD-binding PCMH-type domain-containing protein n=1 Tax=Myxozyma melibiosi TaxID=54550 RepID=A0ABR1FE84_9ASCO
MVFRNSRTVAVARGAQRFARRWTSSSRAKSTSPASATSPSGTTPPPPPPPKQRPALLYAGVSALATAGIATYVFKSKVSDAAPMTASFSDLATFLTSSAIPTSLLSRPRYASAKETAQAIAEISAVIGEANVTSSPGEIESHSTNPACTHHPPGEDQHPAAIVLPGSTEDVSAILKICNRYSVPVVPYSAGTSLEGHIYSVRPGGICIDFRRMNAILAVHEDDLDVVVQAGVPYAEINSALAPLGLVLGSDCAPSAQIGGMVATNASGINAVSYGAMKENTIALTAVLADGTVIKTRQRPRKSSAGYNLTGLLVGSEGTLAVVTEATLKIHVKPKVEKVIVAQFKTTRDTTDAVADIFRAGIKPGALELLDDRMMKALNLAHMTTREWLETPSLFIRVGGVNEKVLGEYTKAIKTACDAHACAAFVPARNQAEGEELFLARKNAHYACLDYGYETFGPECRMWGTDVAVPLSRLSYVLEETRKDFDAHGIVSCVLGHVGDGNFHTNIYFLSDQEARVREITDRMVKRGLENEGTCTGEHGVGNGKRGYLELELGPSTVDAMRKLKMAWDPKRILNPDKVFKIDPEDTGF